MEAIIKQKSEAMERVAVSKYVGGGGQEGFEEFEGLYTLLYTILHLYLLLAWNCHCKINIAVGFIRA